MFAAQVLEGEEKAWDRSQSGDQHPFPFLVFLPPRELQQEDVLRVQSPCLGGRTVRLQVFLVHSQLGISQVIVPSQIWTGVPVPFLQLWT